MPELPDVENFKRYLDSTALRRRIAEIQVARRDILEGITPAAFAARLTGRTMRATRRHGKHLFVRLDDGAWLTFHFGMTGSFAFLEPDQDDPRYVRLRLDFTDGHRLAFLSRRMLARAGMTEDPDAYIRDHGLGVDALALDAKTFKALIAGKHRQIKAALMDQETIAGIGNIFSDEILFQAGVHPKTRVERLDPERLSELYRSMRRVLSGAIARGAGAEDFEARLPAGWIIPRRRKGASCPRGHGELRGVKLGGRTAYFCPRCQPEQRAEH